jgi:NodT family efflux transporter outer membrane factor (OMF) lipoprotein
MRRLSLAACTLLLVALAGCAGPRPQAPAAAAVAPPATWRSEAGATGADVERDWWRAFGDPVLAQVVQTALDHNVDIALAVTRVQEARAQFALALAQQGPLLVAAADGGRQAAVNALGRRVLQVPRQAQLLLSYELDLFGRLASAGAAARAALLASAAAQDTVQLATSGAAASGYIGLRTLDARLDLLRATLDARGESLRIARRRAERGYTSMLELRQAEAEYHATAQQIPATELAISRQEDALSLLLGTNPRAIERGLAVDAMALPPVPAGLPASLLRRRPDIAQAEQLLAAADHSLDSARAAFMPAIRLTASAGFVDSDLFPNPYKVFQLGGSVLAPIFDSGRLSAQADSAAARRDQAAYAYRKAALTAFREVDDALAALRRNQEQETELAAQRDALALGFELARKRYQAGYSAYLEQVDAQRGLLSAELSLVQARGDRLAAMVTLYQSLGGGWKAESMSSPEVVAPVGYR